MKRFMDFDIHDGSSNGKQIVTGMDLSRAFFPGMSPKVIPMIMAPNNFR